MAKYVTVIQPKLKRKSLLGAYAGVVLTRLTGNTGFPTPNPTLVVFGAHVAALTKCEADVASKVPGAVAACTAAREKVTEDLGHLVDYVEGVAQAQAGAMDLTAIAALVESAGFMLKKVTPRPKLVLAVAQGAETGSMICTAPRSKARDTNQWDYSTDQKTFVDIGAVRQAKMTATGLPVGVPLYVRHRALTKSGFTAWSDPMLITLK
jgi:hypothetical protein